MLLLLKKRLAVFKTKRSVRERLWNDLVLGFATLAGLNCADLNILSQQNKMDKSESSRTSDTNDGSAINHGMDVTEFSD